jgi:hypothetical protein
MQGRIQDALQALDGTLAESGHVPSFVTPELERLAIALLKAHILYLDRREAEALAVFEEVIVPAIECSPPEFRQIIEINRNDVAAQVLQSDCIAEHYRLLDKQRLLSVPLLDYRVLVEAERDAAAGRHYEALPAFWQEFVRTYYQGCWRHNAMAAQRLAEECLCIGQLAQAAYFAVLAQDGELMERVGQHLVASCSAGAIHEAINRILSVAHLHRHAATACRLILAAADAIPDDQVAAVLEWLLPRCSLVPRGIADPDVSRAARSALAAIAWRLNEEQTCRVVQIVVDHHCWTPASVFRKELLDIAVACVRRLPLDRLAHLAQKTLPLALECRNDLDYGEAIELLCQIATRGDRNVNAAIADALYSSGTVVNSVLVQVARVFGMQIEDETAIDGLADRITQQILQQVERLDPARDLAIPQDRLISVTTERESKRVVVHVTSSQALAAVASHRKLIGSDRLRSLVDAILLQVRDADNVLLNKAALISGLSEFADVMSADIALKVIEALEPIADGVASPFGVSPLGSPSPLNRYRINLGDPSTLRGIALTAIAAIAEARPDEVAHRASPLVEKALADPDPEVRRHGIVAAHRMPVLSDALLIGLLLGTRDPDPQTAATAFRAIARAKDLQLTDSLQLLLIQSLSLARNSREANVRAAAAAATRRMLLWDSTDRICATLQKLALEFHVDINYSVRLEITRAGIHGDSPPSGQD